MAEGVRYEFDCGLYVDFSCIGGSLFYGLGQYIGDWYACLMKLSTALIIYGILWGLYKHNIFLKV